jgi:acyl-CoA synthetase (NDP forming)
MALACTTDLESLLAGPHRDQRDRLLEPEVYDILRRVGIEPPRFFFVGADNLLDDAALRSFATDRVVLKIVSPEVVHKSDEQGVAFCRNEPGVIADGVAKMLDAHAERNPAGVLIAEFIERDRSATDLAGELIVGILASREFGPVLVAGVGGTASEQLAVALKPGRAIARAPVSGLTPERFLEIFSRTFAYESLAGTIRGSRRLVPDEELLRCFGAFIELAQLPVRTSGDLPAVLEIEVNPFVPRAGRLVPLDGRARLVPTTGHARPRPASGVRCLLAPDSIAVLGVSGTNAKNFGRIILANIIGAGFERSAIRVIKPGVDAIDGIACVPSIADLPHPVDLLVVAAGASQLPEIADACVTGGRVRSAVLIPGGAGETDGSEPIARALEQAIERARGIPDGPVFLGPNSMGIQCRPARFDTFFLPSEKLAKRWDAPHRGVALISQSGAFIVRTMSAFESLDPAISVSIGNQCDLTLSDLVAAVADRDDIHTIGVYAEGFKDLDGLDLCTAFADATARGKTVVFYKGGRTPAGRDAAAGHTASLAGDYAIVRDNAERAGALVAERTAEFSRLLEIAALTHGLPVRGARIGAITNAGFESVSIGDQADAAASPVCLPSLPDAARSRLETVLAEHGLAGLVTPRNPLDLTPMATDDAYLDAARAMLEAGSFDALIVSCIPATPAVRSLPAEMQDEKTLAKGLAALRDEYRAPIITVVDAGDRYEPFVASLRAAGLPVLRSADDAAGALARVLANRIRRGQ